MQVEAEVDQGPFDRERNDQGIVQPVAGEAPLGASDCQIIDVMAAKHISRGGSAFIFYFFGAGDVVVVGRFCQLGSAGEQLEVVIHKKKPQSGIIPSQGLNIRELRGLPTGLTSRLVPLFGKVNALFFYQDAR